MDQFLDRFAREGSMTLRDFTRQLHRAGFNMFRGEIVAELVRRGFAVSSAGGQSWIIGLSPQRNSALREFIDENCIRADGLSCKLAAIVKATGLKRTEVIEQLSQWGFDIKKHNGGYVVAGIGTKEVYA